MEDNKDIRRISGTQLENQLQNSWEDLQQVLLDYENSKQGFLTLTVNIVLVSFRIQASSMNFIYTHNTYLIL